MGEIVGVAAPAGVPRTVHVYVRFDSPPSSMAATLSAAAVPEGAITPMAGAKIVGAALVVVIAATPVNNPLVARTVAAPTEAGAV